MTQDSYYKIFTKIIIGIFAASIPTFVVAHGGEHPEMNINEPTVNAEFPFVFIAAIGIAAGIAAFAAYRKPKTAIMSALGVMIVASVLSLLIQYGGISQFSASKISPPPVIDENSQNLLAGVNATVYKSPGCSCCGGYITELKRQGANVTVNEISDNELSAFKTKQGIPADLQSCHTTIIDGYIIEGHMPFEAIVKLRAERPDIKGIALPGMPAGTPGMPGVKMETYSIRTLSGETYLNI